MGDFDGFDLDRSTARAWSLFQSRLADHVADMADQAILLLGVESSLDESQEEGDRKAPYIQFRALGDDIVRCLVSSNEHLAPGLQLSAEGMAKLQELGWRPPRELDAEGEPDSGSRDFSLDFERRDGDRLAVMTVKVLRELFGVPHPAFLSAGNVLDPSDYPDLGIPLSSPAPQPADDEPVAVMPRDPAHLRELVDQALTPAFGHTPKHDADDDVPVVSGSALVFVRVHERLPVVELFSTLVCDVVGLDEAAEAVAELNRDVSMIKFTLHDNSVIALLQLPAMPFAPLHLRQMLEHMAKVADDVDDALVARLGGRRSFDEPVSGHEAGDRSDEVIPAELLTLLHLDPDGRGVEPDLAASVCNYDRDLVLRFLRTSSEEEIAWRKSRDEAALAEDAEEAASCAHEARAWAMTVETLRRALRVIVERNRPTG